MNIYNFIRKHRVPLLITLSGIIPVLLLLTRCIKAYICIGDIYTTDFLFGDASTQYFSLFSYFKDVLDLKTSIIYSFSKNLGGSMISTYAYYLSSPLNFMIKFFDKSNISLFFTILVFLKISLAGITMFLYLKNKIDNFDYKLLIFSTAYSLCAYSISYYFNIMWLDVLYLAPLVLLGVDKLFKKDSVFLYTISLAISIFSNFYITYMLCIFLIIYFLYHYILNYQELKKQKKHKSIIIKFILFSILAAGISAIILLPTISDMKNFARYSIDNYNTSFNIFKNFFSKLFIGTHSLKDPYSRNTPNIYFGILPLILSILYFFNKKISRRERILASLVLIFFILSFSLECFNLLLHGGSLPNGYVFRFSFLFSLFMITIAAINFYNSNLHNIRVEKLAILFIVYSIVAIISYFQNKIEFSLILLIINIIFCFGYLLCFSFNFKYRFKIIFLIFIIEMIINVNSTFFLTTDLNVRINLDNINNFCKYYDIFGDNNHRIDSIHPITSLDSLACNSKGISGSISTNNGKLYRFLQKIGFDSTPIGTAYSEQIVMATLLGMKYEITWYPKDNPEYYRFFKNLYFNNFDMDTLIQSIYRLNDNLSIGYLINRDYKYNDDNPFSYQNNLIKNFSGINDNIYNILETKEIEKYQYEIEADNSDKLLIFLNSEAAYISETIGELYINDEFIHTYKFADSGIISIKNRWKNQKITIKFVSKKDSKLNSNLITVASLNRTSFMKAVKLLQENQLNITSIKKNTLGGFIDSPKNSYLFVSVPYDKNFKAYVNGKEVKIDRGMDNFMKIYLKKGKNNIKLVYISSLFNIGKYISLLSIIILISYYIIQKKRH